MRQAVVRNRWNRLINVFCPTGEGGGVDPSCSPSGGLSLLASKAREETKTKINSYIENAKQLGVSADSQIRVETKLVSRAGRFLPDNNTIELTEHYVNQYTDPAARSSEIPGWTSISRYEEPSSVLVHECGHSEHYADLTKRFGREGADKLFLAWSKVRGGVGVPTVDGTSVGSKGFKNVAKTVSGYAAANPLEFVAEVYTGRKYGKSYPNIVNGLYQALGGPE